VLSAGVDPNGFRHWAWRRAAVFLTRLRRHLGENLAALACVWRWSQVTGRPTLNTMECLLEQPLTVRNRDRCRAGNHVCLLRLGAKPGSSPVSCRTWGCGCGTHAAKGFSVCSNLPTVMAQAKNQYPCTRAAGRQSPIKQNTAGSSTAVSDDGMRIRSKWQR